MLSLKLKLWLVFLLISSLATLAYISDDQHLVNLSANYADWLNTAKTAVANITSNKQSNQLHQQPSPDKDVKTPSSSQQHPLLGRWIGPEGTYLELVAKSGSYQVLIQDLDTLKMYDATVDGNDVTFVRDGKMESLHASNGDDTGMKWLSGKSDCVTVTLGEGYCRD